MANKQKKKQKKAAQQAQNSQPAPAQPTNQTGDVIEIEFGGEAPEPSRPESPQETIYTQESLIHALSQRGYHRARVTSLEPYDRIVGGIVWLMYMFDNQPRGKEWFFVESEPGAEKTVRDKARECAQLLVVKEDMNCHLPLNSKDLVDVNPAKLGPFIDFLLARTSNEELDEEKYDAFKSFFHSTYETEHAHLCGFIEALHRFNDNMFCDLRDYNKFDYSIMRDEFVTGKMMLFELVNYHRTGHRTYPSLFDESGARKFVEKTRRQDKELRARIDKLADDMTGGVTPVWNILYMANEIDYLRFGRKLTEIECRFLAEAKAYYKMANDYAVLEKSFAFLTDTTEDIIPFDLETVEKVVDTVILRWGDVRKKETEQLEERDKRLYNLRRNHDEYDPEVYWAHDNCEKANNMEKENKLFAQYIKEGKRFSTKIATIFFAYHTFVKVRDNTIPEKEVDDHISLITALDQNIGEDIQKLMTELNDMAYDIETMEYTEDENEMDHRRAIAAYVDECNKLLGDWYWKAKLMKDARMELRTKFKNMDYQTKLAQHKLYYAERESAMLMKLNMLVSENEKEMERRHKAADIFIADWERKKELKAAREAAAEAAKELKRQQDLEAARVAKQTKHAKNGNGKKGQSGKKGRFGLRR